MPLCLICYNAIEHHRDTLPALTLEEEAGPFLLRRHLPTPSEARWVLGTRIEGLRNCYNTGTETPLVVSAALQHLLEVAVMYLRLACAGCEEKACGAGS